MTSNSPVSVAVDGSGHALEAVRWAAKAAQRFGRQLDVVTVLSSASPAFGRLSMQSDKTALAAAREAAEATASAAEELALSVADVTVTKRVVEGKPSLVLRDVSTRSHLLVLGRRGLGGVRGLLLGSVSTDLAAHSECPVVVVSTGAFSDSGPVVVGVDGSVDSTGALDQAFAAAASMKAPLRVVHSFGGFTDEVFQGYSGQILENLRVNAQVVIESQVADAAESHPEVAVDIDLTTDAPAEYISGLSETARLIVVGTRGHGGFRGLALGSTSQAILHVAQCPVMVVQNH
ncbi:MAG: universal stress protein [Gordonia sp. (in: high G+C Gram-positive bacteria)]|uniref:universal stress protein n=1 Tax=Gordonia sp. (in: high G+C Gram-positive bacteria) TaxID=84139 RepID=UPI003C776E05